MASFKFGGWIKASHQVAPSFSSIVKAGAVALNTNQYILPEYTDISYQQLSDCVANATADAFEIVKGLADKTKVQQFSRRFIYWNAREYSNDQSKDKGSYIHLAFESLKRIGACSESTLPYDSNEVFVRPPIQAYREADSNHIDSYFQITSEDDDRVNDVCLAITNNHPVVFGTQVGQDLMNYTGNDAVFEYPSSSVGGHALCIVGFRTEANGKKSFFVRNSWGNSWGLNGHFWMSQDYLKHSETSDLFVPTMTPDLLID